MTEYTSTHVQKTQAPRWFSRKTFYRQNFQGVLQDTWPSSDWLVVRSQGGVPGVCFLVPASLVSPSLCSAWSYHPPPGWGLSSYRRPQWHALLCTSLVEEAGHWPVTTVLFLSTCAHRPKQFLLELRKGHGGWKSSFYKEETRDKKIHLFLGGPHRSYRDSIPLFFDNPQLVGNRCWTRKGITFWIEMLIINSAEELGFMRTWYQHDKINGDGQIKKYSESIILNSNKIGFNIGTLLSKKSLLLVILQSPWLLRWLYTENNWEFLSWLNSLSCLSSNKFTLGF